MSNSGQPNDCLGHNLPQPATAIVSHRVRPDKIEEYRLAQTAISRAARNFPGFIGTEVLSPVPGLQEDWIVIFRLESNQAMKRWLESIERAGSD
jgi:antibiotic biosynthesis monooxygenase (ABM) superfamily enzyme